MDSEVLRGERARFAKVVAARKTNKELLQLFEKLDTSDKFNVEAKPHLFADLIDACVKRVSTRQTMELLEVMEQTGAARLVRAVNSAPEADDLLKSVVKKAFTSSPKETSSLMEAFVRLERSGVSEDRGHTLDLAFKAGMTVEDLDPICDLTFEAYYPSFARKHDAVPA